ncbi:MAG: 23S rRNA (adenine(2503)-C(2))-methyltransferase RlmN [Desulfovibrio sp.]|nr:23S rRNA (adenine(2503)-C(2))-methyltransferase RlmN [Desulfovibrio sp.]
MDISKKFLPDGRANLAEFTLPELERWFVEELGEPRFRAEQVWQWIWRKLERDFDSMSNVSKKLRQKLKEKAAIALPEIEKIRESSDGSVKMLLRLSDGEKIETVLIPAENRMGNIRWSQCLSTQAGCPMRCSFCATGQMGFKRNLTMGEILGQVAIGREYLDDRRLDWPTLRNLVFMGMGEPLLNLDALIPALESLASEKGMNFSPRRLTVSTCGIPGALEKLGESGLAYLAVSLHAPTRELREELMPGAAKWPLEDMMAALESYPLKTRERVTYEYLLLGGVNDSPDHARALAKLLSRTRGKVNLIVYNPVPGLPYKRPSDETVAAFQKILFDKNIMCIVRKSRGADIEAACGQLAIEEPVEREKTP